MSEKKERKDFATMVFTFRSYSPVPFLIAMLVFEQTTVWSIIGGIAIVLLGEFIRLWGVSWAGSETRTTGKVGGSFLIISGPFAFVKNPLYVGNILIYSGMGVMSYALFPWLPIGALIFFIAQYWIIVKREEVYLKEAFGSDYEDYYKKVPRFFPRLTPYRKPEIEQPEFSWQAGFRSERRTLQAISIVTVLLLIKWILRVRLDWDYLN
jgi:protein-S-isoprenylcysteine O-methyltransferase Ste14